MSRVWWSRCSGTRGVKSFLRSAGTVLWHEISRKRDLPRTALDRWTLDPHGQERCADAEEAGDVPGGRVVVEVVASDAGHGGGDGGADLVRGEDPAEDDRRGHP